MRSGHDHYVYDAAHKYTSEDCTCNNGSFLLEMPCLLRQAHRQPCPTQKAESALACILRGTPRVMAVRALLHENAEDDYDSFLMRCDFDSVPST